MSTATEQVRVRSVARGAERTDQAAAGRGAAPARLGVFIGRWLNEGVTVAGPDAPAMTIHASDVYEWAPGGFFVVHSAYGRIGAIDVGGVEILGLDNPSGVYRSTFFDSFGNVSANQLTEHDGVWTWQAASTRCRARFSEDGRVQTAHHERSDDGGLTWQPSMEVTLRRVG